MTNKEKTIEKIIAYFENNEDVFNSAIEELDNYNGFLGDDRYYEMEMLNEFFCDDKPIDILYRAFYGYDADNWQTGTHGDREHAEFNPNRDYFTYNGYGNLVSTNYIDYSDKLDEYTIEELSENRYNIDAIDNNPELAEMFDELEEDETEDE